MLFFDFLLRPAIGLSVRSLLSKVEMGYLNLLTKHPCQSLVYQTYIGLKGTKSCQALKFLASAGAIKNSVGAIIDFHNIQQI